MRSDFTKVSAGTHGFVRPSGADSVTLPTTHGLRRGLHSFAPSELPSSSIPKLKP